jgi:hypothetical protein
LPKTDFTLGQYVCPLLLPWTIAPNNLEVLFLEPKGKSSRARDLVLLQHRHYHYQHHHSPPFSNPSKEIPTLTRSEFLRSVRSPKPKILRGALGQGKKEDQITFRILPRKWTLLGLFLPFGLGFVTYFL